MYVTPAGTRRFYCWQPRTDGTGLSIKAVVITMMRFHMEFVRFRIVSVTTS